MFLGSIQQKEVLGFWGFGGTETATLEAAAESGVVRRVSEAGRDSRSVQRLFKAFKRMDKLEEAMGEN